MKSYTALKVCTSPWDFARNLAEKAKKNIIYLFLGYIQRSYKN
jgi:hypothetical protein